MPDSPATKDKTDGSGPGAEGLTPKRLLERTYGYFHHHGHWPFVRALQTEYGPGVSVRAMAAEAGRDRIFCQEGADGRCMLTLQGLATIPAAAADLERLAAAVSFIATQFEQHGAVPVDRATIGETLGVRGVELARLGGLLSLTSGISSGGTWSPDNSTFSVTPTEEAFFFRDVKSFKDVETARAQVDRDRSRIAEVQSTQTRRTRTLQPDRSASKGPMATGKPVSLETTFATYTLGALIGQGGAGRVHAVVDHDGVAWAAKLLEAKAVSAERRKRFKNEILFAQRNRHPHLISVTDHGTYSSPKGSLPFYVMPRLSGSLRTLMPTITESDARLRYFAQILDGVEAAHLLGVVHRDLKPENILYDQVSDALLVADFGIAHFTDEELYTAVETALDTRLANFQYAAPEQKVRGQATDSAADIFALGLILNEMFTGVVPHGTEYRLIATVAPGLAWLDPLVAAMLRQDPNERLRTIESVKRKMIAHREDFVTRQRLSEISNTVLTTTDLDDPFATSPPKIVDFRWSNGTLTLVFSTVIPEQWVWALQNMGSHTSVLGAGPEAFTFSGNQASVNAREAEVQRIIDYFKAWLPATTNAYRGRLLRERREEEERVRATLRAEQEELERQQQLREQVRL
jgi:serine/threonine protein kinase